MKTKLLLLAVLCACQGGFTMFAMEDAQPAQTVQQNVASASVQPTNDAFALFQRRGIVLACLIHPRLSATLPNLSADCLKCIGGYLKETCKFRCPAKGCDFSAWDENEFLGHDCEFKCYKCSICGRAFATQRAQQRHELIIHIRMSTICSCDVCGKRFSRFTNFKQHRMQHAGS